MRDVLKSGVTKYDNDIKDGSTADLYIAMLNAVAKIEKDGVIGLDEVERIDHCCWVFFMEMERKQEEAT